VHTVQKIFEFCFWKFFKHTRKKMVDVPDFASVGLEDEAFGDHDEGDEELEEEAEEDSDDLSDLSLDSDEESCFTSEEEEEISAEEAPMPDMFGSVATAFKQYRKLFRTNKVAFEPNVDRAVITGVLKELMAADGFTARKPNPHHDIALLASRPNGDLMACFWDPNTSNKVGIEQMRVINDLINSMNIKRALVISQQPITAKAASSLHANACVVLEKSLAHNYTEHVLVPKQALAVPPSVLTRLKINPDKLPKMSSKDPVAVWFGWKPGMVVQSRRVLGGAMEPHDYFREVCEIKH
jgi:DNA-directed RNA polymerase subunit H (RpoH/RPB5)